MMDDKWFDLMVSVFGEDTPVSQVAADFEDPTFRRGFQSGVATQARVGTHIVVDGHTYTADEIRAAYDRFKAAKKLVSKLGLV